jgi:hypothetical protein
MRHGTSLPNVLLYIMPPFCPQVFGSVPKTLVALFLHWEHRNDLIIKNGPSNIEVATKIHFLECLCYISIFPWLNFNLSGISVSYQAQVLA